MQLIYRIKHSMQFDQSLDLKIAAKNYAHEHCALLKSLSISDVEALEPMVVLLKL